jgi:hypothetical protein
MRALLGPFPRATLRPMLLGLAPFGLHVASFLAGVPSQNAASRFQAPATLALFYVAFSLAAARLGDDGKPSVSRGRGLLCAAIAVLSLYPTGVLAARAAEDAFAINYVNVLARKAGRFVDARDHIATTEAGRLPYWTDAPTIDLVGLNSRETAHRPPNAGLLDAFAPDVIMLHPAGALDEVRLVGASSEPVIRIAEPLASFAHPWRLPTMRFDLPSYGELRDYNASIAPIATMAWLDARPGRYEVYAAHFTSRFASRHVFAVRTDWAKKEPFLRALEDAERSPRASYLSLLRD